MFAIATLLYQVKFVLRILCSSPLGVEHRLGLCDILQNVDLIIYFFGHTKFT